MNTDLSRIFRVGEILQALGPASGYASRALVRRRLSLLSSNHTIDWPAFFRLQAWTAGKEQ
jgi:hypothetical protein